MRMRTALGLGMIVGLLVGMGGRGVTPAQGDAFFTEGTVQQSEAANDFGKTIAHYGLNYGFTLLALGLVGGGLVSMKKRPGEGWIGVGGGLATGYIGKLVRAGHDPATAADTLEALLPTGAWELWVVGLGLQAACAAALYCAWRARRDVETLQ